MSKAMTASQMGKKGGSVRGGLKAKKSAQNLAVARAMKRLKKKLAMAS